MRLTEVNIITLNSFLEREGFPTIAEDLGEEELRTLLTTARNHESQDIQDKDTAIHRAARLGNIDIINIMLTCEVDVNLAKTDGVTPLLIAVDNRQLDVAQLLLDNGAEVNKARTNGETPLLIAVDNRQLDVAQLLLDNGAEVNQARTNGETPLWFAAYDGLLAVAKLLLKRGANVNQARTTDGTTPLFVAAQLGQLALAQLLLDNGAEVNQARTNRATPLFAAAQEGQLDVVQLLLERGADVNQAMTNRETPLYIAELFCANTSVTLLLKLAGAKRDAIDFETNDEVIKQALKASAMLQIITQRFPASETDLRTAIETTLDNITSIDGLLSFNKGLERKFNKIIHPSSTADISHMVNQFLPGQLPDELIGKIANPEIKNLAEHGLRGTINTGAIVAQIITDHLQAQAVQAPAQAAAATKIQAVVRGRKGREEAQEATVETGQTHTGRLVARGQEGFTKSSCSIS
jgi:ankyrin repeat protein